MDVELTERGTIVPFNGDLPTISGRRDLLAQYFHAALVDAITSSDIGFIGRVSELRNLDTRDAVEVEAKRSIIEAILQSDFSSDFDPSLIDVAFIVAEDNSVTIKATYGDSENEKVGSISKSFEIVGGSMVLKEEDIGAYQISDLETIVMREEVQVSEATQEVPLSTEGLGFIIITNPKEDIRSLVFVGNTNDIPEDKRFTIITTNPVDGQTTIVGIPPPDVSPGLEGTLDTIFLRSLFPSLSSNDFSISVKDTSGNVTSINFVESADDYLLNLDTSNHSIRIEIDVVKSIARAFTTTTLDLQSGAVDRYAFPNDHIRGPRVAIFDKVIEPGLYTVIYSALIKPDYDASLLRRY